MRDLSGKTVPLNKSLYGLKQAARSWFDLLVSTLTSIGFEQCKSEPCVLRLLDSKSKKVRMILAVHVDDMVVAGNSKDCKWLHERLCKVFPVNNLGPLTWYTGCAFERSSDSKSIKIVQTAFIDKIIERFNIRTTAPTPASSGRQLRPKEEAEPGGQWPYREAVGSLMWVATMSRPDIANAVREVARHAHDPSRKHWDAVQRILKFLKYTRTMGLTFDKGKGLDLVAYSDSDYARDEQDRRSVSGAAIMCSGACVSWFSRTQRCVTTSSSEAEYVAMGDCVKEALFVRNVLAFIDPTEEGKRLLVKEDNEGAIRLANNPLSSGRSRHIDVRHHFLRELVKEQTIKIEHVDTSLQHADVLTKPLDTRAFRVHRDFLLNRV